MLTYKAAILGLLSSAAHACVQVEIESVKNTGQITDYLSSGDEIKMSFGSSYLFYYTFEMDFSRYTTAKFPSGAISFPCLSSESLWIELKEIDLFVDDTTRIVLDCAWLQATPGTVNIPLYEDKNIGLNTATFTKSSSWQTFSYSENGRASSANYEIGINVRSTCTSVAALNPK